jgi:hypothetical protein
MTCRDGEALLFEIVNREDESAVKPLAPSLTREAGEG